MKEGDESDDKMYVIISGDCSVVIQLDKNVFSKEN